MNVADIQVFTKVAATRSFSEAAELAGITRSAVSKCISRLESELGVILLNRSPRSASLTEAGRVFYEHSRQVDEALERAVTSVSGADQRPSGNVSCSMPSSLGSLLMPLLVRKFRPTWPEITLALHFDDRCVDMVGSSIDVAIRIAPKLGDSSLLARRIGATRQVLVASAAYLDLHGTPATIRDLKDHRCLAVGNGQRRQAFWRFAGAGGPVEAAVPCSTTSNSSLALIHAACMDDGIVCIPELLVRGELQNGLLHRVLPEFADDRSFGVFAISPNMRPPVKIRAFIDFVEEQLPLLDTMRRWAPLGRQWAVDAEEVRTAGNVRSMTKMAVTAT